jgi:translation initiation factor IF-3
MLIDHNNENHGVVATPRALEMATIADLDLVEVAPNARPPVARIMDYSKFVYEKKRRDREARKNQKKIEIKTIKLKLKTSEFHRNIQVKKSRGWLEEGKKVKVEIRFYGREITYPELGRKIMDSLIVDLADVGAVEQAPQFEGRTMVMMLAPQGSKQTQATPETPSSETTAAPET